jgi:hypothetical protein
MKHIQKKDTAKETYSMPRIHHHINITGEGISN